MKKVTFDPNGSSLKVDFQFKGFIVASYTYTLWEADSNHRIVREKGNNQNPQDDSYELPVPLSSNKNRLIQLRTEFVAQDPDNIKEYSILAEVYQGDQLIGSAEDQGANTGSSQDSLLFIMLTTS